MDTTRLKELVDFTEHAQWLANSLRKVRACATQLRINNTQAIAVGTTEIAFSRQEYRQILVDAFEELDQEMTKAFGEMQFELDPQL